MFRISNLNVFIEGRKILDNFNIDIADGEIHAIMGKNGIGKSTLCKIIMGYPNFNVNGSISFNGKELINKNPYEISMNGVMLISQNPPSIEGVTNAEALRVALKSKNNGQLNIFEFNKQMEEICNKLNLDKSFIHKQINVGASGGERKKIELLHMAMLKPKFLILDEIDSGLDVDALKDVSNFINEYVKENKISLLLITHHKNILDYIKPNYVHILSEGKIIKTGDYHLAEKIENEGFSSADDIKTDDKNE